MAPPPAPPEAPLWSRQPPASMVTNWMKLPTQKSGSIGSGTPAELLNVPKKWLPPPPPALPPRRSPFCQRSRRASYPVLLMSGAASRVLHRRMWSLCFSRFVQSSQLCL